VPRQARFALLAAESKRDSCDDVAVDPIYRPGVVPEPPELCHGQVLLRRWSYDDLPCIEEVSRDPVIPTGTTVPNPFSEEAGRAFVERQWGRFASGEGLVLAMAEAATGTATGMICLLHRQQPGVVGVGYFTVASCRRRSSARTSLSLLSRWALSLPGIVRLEALIQPENEGSIRVVESVGFHREGLLRRYLDLGTTRDDVFLYSLIQEDVDGFDPETRNIANLA
jgi:ribosomal-protein-alanine N-acetyltransferase